MQNNCVEISGTVLKNFEFDHEKYGEKFYIVELGCRRSSGIMDVIKLELSDKYFYTDSNILGEHIYVTGNIRTHNFKDDSGTHLKVAVYVEDLDVIDIKGDSSYIDVNFVYLEGHFCKINNSRITPKGKKISDTIIAINRDYSRNDYIPCIFWNKSANIVDEMNVGDEIKICGRLQSRNYEKVDGDQIINKVAYEVSVQNIK